MISFLTVVPLTRLPRTAPQLLSYTHRETLAEGTLVRIAIGSRLVNGVILQSRPAAQLKGAIKRLPHRLKSISSVLSATPVLWPWQISFARWLAAEFFEPLSLVIISMLPSSLIRRKRPLTLAPSCVPMDTADVPPRTPTLLDVPLDRRLAAYQRLAASGQSLLVLCPDQERRNTITRHLGIPSFDASLRASDLLRNWNAIRGGELHAVAGTRSGLMAPFPSPADLTVVLEEESSDLHASADQHPMTDIRIAAEELRRMGAQLVIGDQLPSVERIGRLRLAPPQLPRRRYAVSSVVDLASTPRAPNAPTITIPLAEALEETVHRNERALLFVARRGLATLLLCADCGWRNQCPSCHIPLVAHADRDADAAVARCHRCGHRENLPLTCPSCASPHIRHAGIGTQRVEEHLQALFPNANIARVDTDTPSSSVANAADIIVGTDLAIRHLQGRRFTVTAAVSIETLLHLPDYAAGETIFRRLMTLRSAAKRGFFIQTYTPESAVLRLAADGDIASLYRNELRARRTLAYPPYADLAVCRRRGADAAAIEQEATALVRTLESRVQTLGAGVRILGPSPSFYRFTKGLEQWQIVIKWPTAPSLNARGSDPRERNQLLALIPPAWDIVVHPTSILS